MKLPVPFVQLPLIYDAPRLAAEVAAIEGTAWRPHPQGYAGNDAVSLIAVHGDPHDDAARGPMRSTPHLQQLPYLRQVLASLGTVLGRTRLMRLSGHAEVSPHVDVNYYWRDRVRVHVPIVTQPTVRFSCGGAETNMAAGECWIFDTWRMHRVVNDAAESRIHLVADTVGSQSFWDLVDAGRTAESADPAWSARRVAYDPAAEPSLAFESVNVPKVMNPAELREHIAFVFSETEPSPQVQALGKTTARFTTEWRALWARYGEDDAGLPAYEAALGAFRTALTRQGTGLVTRNGQQLVWLMQALVLNAALGGGSKGDPEVRASAPSVATSAPPSARAIAGRDHEFDRPVIVVCPPRSGSSLLFETLARAPGIFTIGGESHALIESVAALRPDARGFESNRLDATAATPATIAAIRARFIAAARDRDGRPPAALPLRLLEKTPKNSLRVPFLAQAFPEARFVYLYREPRQVLSSMIEAWESGRFRTYKQLPGWTGTPWSLVLVPGWRELIGKPLHQVVAAQWAAATQILLDDLAALTPERRVVARYDSLLSDPTAEIGKLCAALELDWDGVLGPTLPLARHTISVPAPDKWRRHARQIDEVLPGLQLLLERAAAFAAT